MIKISIFIINHKSWGNNIFEKFYRAEISAKIKGSGLGLSIIKGIVQAHKGNINATKRNGELVLSIILPIELNNGQMNFKKDKENGKNFIS